MPVPICLRKNSEQGLILRGIKCQTAPSSHEQKINSRLGILIILLSQLIYPYIHPHKNSTQQIINTCLALLLRISVLLVDCFHEWHNFQLRLQFHPINVFIRPFHHWQDVIQGQFSSWSKARLNSEFSFS